VTTTPDIPTETQQRKSFLRSFVRWIVIAAVVLWSLAALALVAARWIDPPTTAVHVERRLQAWIHRTPYRERYKFIPLSQISPNLQHAVVAAEDARFYQHHGFDWHAIQLAAEEDMEGDRTRGARRLRSNWSKPVFRNEPVDHPQGGGGHISAGGRTRPRQAAHSGTLPQCGRMGTGIYGAESACRYHDGIAARNIGRQQAARLAAILPAPLKRRPERMNNYSSVVLKRMRQAGW